jgi:hypothetical protein
MMEKEDAHRSGQRGGGRHGPDRNGAEPGDLAEAGGRSAEHDVYRSRAEQIAVSVRRGRKLFRIAAEVAGSPKDYLRSVGREYAVRFWLQGCDGSARNSDQLRGGLMIERHL